MNGPRLRSDALNSDTVIHLRDSETGSTASILPSAGFNCFSFKPVVNGVATDVLWAEPNFGPASRPSRSGIPLLFPFAGRLRGRTIAFDTMEYEITGASVNGSNVIHGFVMNRPWRVIDLQESAATGVFQASVDDPSLLDQWPADFRISARYALEGNQLSLEIVVVNPDDRALPFGFGAHTYFRLPVGGGSADDCAITVAASKVWPQRDQLPTGAIEAIDASHDLSAGRRFDGLTLDHILSELSIGHHGLIYSVIADPNSGRTVTQRWDPNLGTCVVFTPPHREAIAIEPYSCVPDAFWLGSQGIDAGLRILRPGQRFTTRIEIRID